MAVPACAATGSRHGLGATWPEAEIEFPALDAIHDHELNLPPGACRLDDNPVAAECYARAFESFYADNIWFMNFRPELNGELPLYSGAVST